jgi:hypothetical protein
MFSTRVKNHTLKVVVVLLVVFSGETKHWEILTIPNYNSQQNSAPAPKAGGFHVLLEIDITE